MVDREAIPHHTGVVVVFDRYVQYIYKVIRLALEVSKSWVDMRPILM